MRAAPLLLAGALLLAPACARRAATPIPAGAQVLWEAPESSAPDAAGSRVVLAVPGAPSVLLSRGLSRAGEPAVSVDGRRVVFAGRADERSGWQLWEADLAGGAPLALTALKEGATSPAFFEDGSLVFVSDGSLRTLANGKRAAARLTFGASAASDPTVLADGRVLFVSSQPNGGRRALFAVNDDGTGVSAYACNHDGAPLVARPREVGDRVVFASRESDDAPETTESVLQGRPWLSRAPHAAPELPAATAPGFRVVEAAPLAPSKIVRRRLSTVNPSKTTGQLLCLDVNHTAEAASAPASRVRITAAGPHGPRTLGEVPLAADGSFFAEVPADVPLGVDALDSQGRVLRSVAPWFWVRPGETRGCIGCHEPHGRAPRNRRPLAVKALAANVAVAGAS